MATPAQCYYCFESIAAAFEDEDPPSLSAIEELWEQHEQAKQLAVLKDKRYAFPKQNVSYPMV
jgi:hypothetical protein